MKVDYMTYLRLPFIKTYFGRNDTEAHVNTFYGSMIMIGSSDAVVCRMFFLALGGQAVDWFKTLEPNSIESFQQLSTLFIKRFAILKAQKKHFTHMEYDLNRWTFQFGEVELVDNCTAITTFHNLLRLGKLYESFFTNPPMTYDKC